MSMITEALKKAETAAGTSEATTPFWIYRAALVGCVAVVLLGIAHFTHRPATRATVPAQTAKTENPWR